MYQDRSLGNFSHETGDDLVAQRKLWPVKDLGVLFEKNGRDKELDSSIKSKYKQ